MKVLVVEDDTDKFGQITSVLEAVGVPAEGVSLAICAADAVSALKSGRYELMLLDVNLPRRRGETAIRGGGLEVLRELGRDETLTKPRYVVGVTAYEDVVEEFGDVFDEHLWSLVHYNPTSDLWIAQLKSKVEYIQSAEQSRQFSDGITFGVDIALLCALDTVELSGIRGLPCGWQPLRLPHDETRYFIGTMNAGGGTISVLAAAAPRMGMTASAVLATKVVHQFRPRVMALVGICAGRFGKVGLGDVIIADPTWDYGAGKIESVDDQPKFLPAPHQFAAEQHVLSAAKDIGEDGDFLRDLKRRAHGTRPAKELEVRVGPMACGAAVVADAQTFTSLLDQHRGILALEMESYGAAGAVQGASRPRPTFFVCKAVCDFADKDKDDDFQEYAADVSAGFAIELARRLLPLSVA